MNSISNERNWLTWLVKVRILILMVLLAIELAIIQLTPRDPGENGYTTKSG